MNQPSRWIAACLAGILLCLPAPGRARTWYIRADGSGDAPTIQAGIDSATAGDDVLVASGVYAWNSQGMGSDQYGPTMVDVAYGIRLHSESGAAVTVLDAQQQGRVLQCRSCAGIEGFTITNGRTVRNADGGYEGMGGGIFSFGGEPVFAHNIIRFNYAGGFGGGIHVHAGTPVIRFNAVSWNTAGLRSGGIDLLGGDAAVVENNTVAGNLGGGIACVYCVATIAHNIIADSGWSASGHGGGFGMLCLLFEGNSVHTDCNLLWNNVGGDNPCGTSGGGNLSDDPRFCVSDPNGIGALAVRPDSPALPANNPCGVLIGSTGEGCETTAAPEPGSHRTTLTVSPNPPRGHATIHYSAAYPVQTAQVTVFDLAGRVVARLVDGGHAAGPGSVTWDGRGEGGAPVSAGVYIVRLDTGQETLARKIVLLR